MPPRKAADRRQGRGTSDIGQLASLSAASEIPAVPHPRGGSLLAETEQAWVAFWRDDIAQLVKPADLPALTRLFRMYDERERADRAYRAERAVTGSTGQLVVNPFAKEVASLDGRIEKLEARFGITPKARMDLGVSFGAAARSLEELNRAFDDDPDEDEDPRLAAIDTTAS